MTKNKNEIPENGVLTSSMNIQNRAFKELQLFLLNKANSLSEKERLNIELFSIKIKIEDYLKAR